MEGNGRIMHVWTAFFWMLYMISMRSELLLLKDFY
jgi:hypothetical protein